MYNISLAFLLATLRDALRPSDQLSSLLMS